MNHNLGYLKNALRGDDFSQEVVDDLTEIIVLLEHWLELKKASSAMTTLGTLALEAADCVYEFGKELEKVG